MRNDEQVVELLRAAQQVVRTCPAGVDVEEIGRLEMSSGESDLNNRVNSNALVSVESHCSKLLCRVQPDGDPGCCSGWKTWKFRSSPTNTTMTRAERLSIQLYCMLATDLQEENTASGPTSSQRSRVRSMETAVQEIWTASSGEIPWNAPSSSCRRRNQPS